MRVLEMTVLKLEVSLVLNLLNLNPADYELFDIHLQYHKRFLIREAAKWEIWPKFQASAMPGVQRPVKAVHGVLKK